MISFSPEAFTEPDAIYWPGYFWLWNGPLDPDVLRAQLCDMHAHGARSVCTLPMPREFRPDSTNNLLDVPYLSPAFFDRVRLAVEEARRLGMHYWLYDEGGWPSGEACGQVTQDHPELRATVLRLQEDGGWQIERTDGVDRLNPDATARFLALTHDRYRDAVGETFGTTIRIAFTDEPGAGAVYPGHSLPWTDGLGDVFARRFGYRVEDRLDAFRKEPETLTPDDMRVRVDFFDCWSQRFVDAYLLPLRRWCREHGVLAGGHFGGEDETLGSVCYGFGHILRALRTQDVPGVDVIWRQLFPGQANHHFPYYASSVAHQAGTPYAFTESFAVYGNGLTPVQMKWVTDYQFARGITLMVGACYPLALDDHLMGGERPHFGPVNPLWDYLPAYHAYTARLGHALGCGTPAVETGLYFPVRDMWASGLREPAADGCEAIVGALEARQRAFDLLDDDLLGSSETRWEDGACRIGPMAYKHLIVGPCAWLAEPALQGLAAFVRAGGDLLCLQRLPGADGDAGERFRDALGVAIGRVRIFTSPADLAEVLPAAVTLDPPGGGIRALARQLDDGALYFFWNEGETAYDGQARLPAAGPVAECRPESGEIVARRDACHQAGGTQMPLRLAPGASLLLLCGPAASSAAPRPWETLDTLELSSGWQARAVRRFAVGPHRYEIDPANDAWQPMALGPWAARFTEDFSGEVAYRCRISVRDAWRGQAAKLALGLVEYAAEVRVNGTSAGRTIWAPWEVELPGVIAGDALDIEIVVAGTLANTLTADSTRRDWTSRTGPGWPGVYDARAAAFERESRGGGLHGPVMLIVGRYAGT